MATTRIPGGWWLCLAALTVAGCADEFTWTVSAAEGVLIDGEPFDGMYVRAFASFDEASAAQVVVSSTDPTVTAHPLVPGEHCHRCTDKGWLSEDLYLSVYRGSVVVSSGECRADDGACVFAQ